MSITRRYVHPQEHTVREAMGRARVAAEKLDKPFDLPNTQYHGQKAKKRLPIDALGAAVFRDSFGDPVENDLGWEIRKVCEFVRAFEGGKNVNPAEDESPSHRHA